MCENRSFVENADGILLCKKFHGGFPAVLGPFIVNLIILTDVINFVDWNFVNMHSILRTNS